MGYGWKARTKALHPAIPYGPMDPYGTPMKAMATPPSWSPQRHAWQVNAHGKKTYLVQGTAGYLNTWNLWENWLKKQPGLITGLYESSFMGGILLGSRNPKSKSGDALNTVQLKFLWKLFNGWSKKSSRNSPFVSFYNKNTWYCIADISGYSRNYIYIYMHIHYMFS